MIIGKVYTIIVAMMVQITRSTSGVIKDMVTMDYLIMNHHGKGIVTR